jgi:alpha-L-rhamnosidase
MGTAFLFVAALHCEFLVNPMGLETQHPRLGWVLRAPERGQSQSAYQVLVASTPELLAQHNGDLWDSGKVRSGQSTHVVYQGKPLSAGQRAFWKARVWDQDGRPTDWATPGHWEMGKLRPEDWQARWIAMPPQPEGTPQSLDDAPGYSEPPSAETVKHWTAPEPQNGAPQFRKEFVLQQKPVKRARAYVCGLGYYEMYLNGARVVDSGGPRVLEPAQTDYEQRALYSVYDLMPVLPENKVTVGIVLGNGFFNQRAIWGDMGYGKPRCLAQIEIEYADGARDVWTTDETWKAMRGPILANNVYAGEHYDARFETPGWEQPGFDDSGWFNAQPVGGPGGRLEAQLMPPVRVAARRAPVSFKQTDPGVWTFDFGQNFSGWAHVEARGPAGTTVRMRYAEALGPDGRVDTASTGVFATFTEQVDTYVCKGTGIPEFWEPRFTYHGFRYVEVSGLTREPNEETLQGVVVRTETPMNGSFTCSDPVLNKLHDTALWTMQTNIHGVPTDCPAREKCGWLGDAHIVADMCLYNFYMPQFWRKYLRDIETSRRGGIPTMVAPGKRTCGQATPDWATALIQIPWNLYQFLGDEQALAEHYEGMRVLMEQLMVMAKDNILEAGLGDWCPPGSVEPVLVPAPLTSTAYLYLDATIMAETANALGKLDDADRYRGVARKTREAFIAKFYDAARKTYGSQTANAFALYLGLHPEEDAQAIADSLARDVNEKHNGHHTTGITGSKYLYWALGEHGHGSTALRMLRNTDYPSFGHLFSLGATTFWECWGEKEIDQKWGARSLNHPMQGAFDMWFYYGIAGIRPDATGPGFQRILFAPQIIDELEFAKADFASLYGNIHAEWRKEAGHLIYSVSVPTNSQGRVHLPLVDPVGVLESGKPLLEAVGVRLLRQTARALEYEVVSGSYEFSLPWPAPAADLTPQ